MSLDSLQELTNGFSKELGRGSFGAVYEVRLVIYKPS
jgi:hypothetical protein